MKKTKEALAKYQANRAPAKGSREQAAYRAGNPLKNCGLCEHFMGNPGVAPDACEVVAGDISPFGYCDWYKRQQNPFGNDHQYQLEGDMIVPLAKRNG